MIPIPSSRVWIATGHTDMRRGMQTLALTIQVMGRLAAKYLPPHAAQQCSGRDPHSPTYTVHLARGFGDLLGLMHASRLAGNFWREAVNM